MKKSSVANIRTPSFSQLAAVLILATIVSTQAASLTTDFSIVFQHGNHLQNAAPQNVPVAENPAGNSTGSGVAYWPARDSYLLLDNNPRRLLEFTLDHAYVRTITLDGFLDPEDIQWMYGNTFVIAQERHIFGQIGDGNPDSADQLVIIELPGDGDNIASINDAGVRVLTISTDTQNGGFLSADNKGIEGVAVLGGYFYFTTENAPSQPANSWKVWKVPVNANGGVVVPVAAFSLAGLLPAGMTDVSGMATDGTDLWLLSDDGKRVIKVSTAGALLADFQLPTDNGFDWNQAEGIGMFFDPDDLRLKILLTGEKDDGAGVDFMLLKAKVIKLATVNATGGWMFYPFLNGGGSQQYYSTASAINVAGLVNPAPQPVLQRLQPEFSTLTVNGLPPGTQHRVRVHLSSIQFTGSQNVSQNVWVSNGGSPNWAGNVNPYASGFNQGVIVDLGLIFPSAAGQLFVGISPTAPGKIVIVSGVEISPGP